MQVYSFNKMSFWFVFTFVFSIFLVNSVIASESNKEEGSKTAMDPQMQAMMAKFQEYASPNENHKVLDVLVGNWNHNLKYWMAPNSKPEISTGTTQSQWILGGRYLQQLVKGVSMGQPFEGIGIAGFDNSQKRYQTIWMDNMGTGMMIGKGTYDSAEKELNDKGHLSDPIAGQMDYRAATKFIDNDHYSYKIYINDQNGKEFLMLDIAYTRTK